MIAIGITTIICITSVVIVKVAMNAKREIAIADKIAEVFVKEQENV